MVYVDPLISIVQKNLRDYQVILSGSPNDLSALEVRTKLQINTCISVFIDNFWFIFLLTLFYLGMFLEEKS